MSITTIVPNLDLALEHKDVFVKSAPDVSVRQWPSTDINNNNQSSYNCPPPNTSVFIDRCIVLGMPFTVTYAGSIGSGTGLLQTGYDALRAYPMASITNNINMIINNQSFAFAVSDIIPYIGARFWPQQMESTFPDAPDTYNEYNEPTGLTAINNPLGAYYNTISDYEPRGAFPMVVVNGATSSTISGTLFEPLWLPILHKNYDEGLGLTNIKGMSCTLTFNSNIARIVSHAINTRGGTPGADTLSGVTVQLGTGTLYMKYSSAPMDYIPRPVSYACDAIERVSTVSTVALTPSAVMNGFTSSNMQLNAIPEWMLIFVREANSNLTYTMTDSALVIDGITITFNNKSGILASASPIDLYNISRENGLQDIFAQFTGTVDDMTSGTNIPLTGSFLMLRFGKDISLTDDTYPGKVGAYNMQIRLNIHNQSATRTIALPSMYIIYSTPQKVVFHEGGHAEVIYGIEHPQQEYYAPYDSSVGYYGGSFKDFLTRVGSKMSPINDWLRKTQVISKIAKVIPWAPAQSVGNVASMMGYGGELDGGMIMSRQELQRRMKQLK